NLEIMWLSFKHLKTILFSLPKLKLFKIVACHLLGAEKDFIMLRNWYELFKENDLLLRNLKKFQCNINVCPEDQYRFTAEENKQFNMLIENNNNKFISEIKFIYTDGILCRLYTD
ncbi:unnamed protein product, partial [Didymodactylos carnosus]